MFSLVSVTSCLSCSQQLFPSWIQCSDLHPKACLPVLVCSPVPACNARMFFRSAIWIVHCFWDSRWELIWPSRGRPVILLPPSQCWRNGPQESKKYPQWHRGMCMIEVEPRPPWAKRHHFFTFISTLPSFSKHLPDVLLYKVCLYWKCKVKTLSTPIARWRTTQSKAPQIPFVWVLQSANVFYVC